MHVNILKVKCMCVGGQLQDYWIKDQAQKGLKITRTEDTYVYLYSMG